MWSFWGGDLANLGKAIAPFIPRFRNLLKVRDRLLVDVAEAGFDAHWWRAFACPTPGATTRPSGSSLTGRGSRRRLLSGW